MLKRFVIFFAAALILGSYAASAQEPDQTQVPEQTQILNKKNLVIKEWNMDAKGNKKVLDHVTTYNAEGRKIEEIEYGSGSQKWRKRYEWGPNGKMSRELVYDERNRLVTEKKFEYNEYGRKKRQYTYNAKGKLLTIKEFEYIVEDA